MAVGVFPAFKLGVLFLKQISKPLAKLIVEQAKSHPVFRTYFIIPPAQFYHWAEVKAKMYVMNLGKPSKVAKLNEQMAIELGANLMGEVIIFTVAGGLLVFEYNRQTAKETKREADRQAQIIKFTEDIQALYENSQQQEKQIKYLTTVVEEIAKNPKQKVNLDKLKPVEPTIVVNNNDNNKSDGLSNKNTDEKSVVHRAIGYYEKDVKGTKS
ncbi:putative OPA3-like protein CG13603 [Microplitis mediator]|uniref:putative OPA3-like protein CG13603 n=1 Tax=Microplitis mediator TaxID=375433 RepID=UPI0025570718|nr:putative OPA3-like protein CG13603 [Microplitis mediator]XP_057336816.1 putative OPA3-like protein CG13603 [Microplitis mediator]